MPRRTALRIEALEARDVPAVFGVPWGNASQLTLSFASDGVKASPIDGYGNYSISELFKELNTHIGTSAWQLEILKAFQAWAAPANINIGLVKDNSTSFGDFEADLTQTQNGQLRIGAVPQSPEVAAITTPYHLLSGNRAGDVMLNTAHAYTVGGAGGTRDLYTVLLNEAANALGLDDTVDATSARYGRYTGVRTGISAADRTAVVGMYGTRQNDLFDVIRNDTTAAATPLLFTTPSGLPSARVSTVTGGIVTGDTDVYSVSTAGVTPTSLRVRLNTAGRSLFTGKVEVLSSTGQVLATQSVTSPLQGNISLSLTSGLRSGTTYFVRVTPATTGVFAVGSYQLQVGVNADPASHTPAAPAAFTQYGPDNGTDNSVSTAKPMFPTPGYKLGTRYTVRAELEGGSADKDTYAVLVPGGGKPLSVVVNPGKHDTISPEAQVFRANGAALPVTTLVRAADGRWVGQVGGLSAGEVVYVAVKGRAGSSGSGMYELAADFNSPAVNLHTMVQGNTTAADAEHRVTMAVPESTFFHFALDTWTGGGRRVQMTILNAAGQVVHTLTAADGMNSAQVYLAAGTYTVRFRSVTSSGALSGGASYRWSAARLSDPIDVYDPNDQGSQTPPVTVAPADPGDDIIITDPWSEPIG